MSATGDSKPREEGKVAVLAGQEDKATAPETLRQWVGEHKVCWELSPLVEMEQHPNRPSEMARVGFELQLFGEHAEGTNAGASPGCPVCVALYQRLRAIAVSALPKEEHPSRYELSAFDSSFHLRPEMQWVPEVLLTIRIIHGSDYFKAIDGCEKRCAEEIEQHLRELGAQPKVWRKGRPAGPVTGGRPPA